MIQFDKQSVFIVDDDEDDQFLLQRVFQQYLPACRLKVLDNGIALLDHLQTAEQLPALILLDLNMPYMGGFEALAQMRQEPIYQNLPVVILTTSNQGEDQQRAQELGANGFVTKPSDLEEYGQLMLRLRRDFRLEDCAQ